MLTGSGIKIGLLAYSSQTGLGYQTYDFYSHVLPEKTLVVDLEEHNKMPTFHSKYGNVLYGEIRIEKSTQNWLLSKEACEWLVDGMDVIFVCETPLNYYLFEYARKKGVKIVHQYNFEFLDYFKRKELPLPDLLASPSPWGIEKVQKLGLSNVKLWPVPVDTSKIQVREITKLNTFVHIVGRPAIHDRNGTLSFLTAAKTLGKKYKYKIYVQRPKDLKSQQNYGIVETAIQQAKGLLGSNLEVFYDVEHHEDMYKSGDVLVLPRRYGGLCLPMWEAMSAGMPVIMTNISPNNQILPLNWLCESRIIGCTSFRVDIALYEAIAYDLVDVMERMSESIRVDSEKAYELARNNSWEIMLPRIINWLEQVCNSN